METISSSGQGSSLVTGPYLPRHQALTKSPGRCGVWLVCYRRCPSSSPIAPSSGATDSLAALFRLQRHAPLLTLPSKAKLNAITLGHYPHSKRLTATQIISLHLVLYRPAIGCESDDPHFGPYISILPRDFGDHPLTWIVHRTLSRGSHKEHRLLDLLPPSVLADLLLLERRFWKDWEAVRQYMVRPMRTLQLPAVIKNDFGQDDLPELSSRRHRTRLPSDLILDFMWAWLNGREALFHLQLETAFD